MPLELKWQVTGTPRAAYMLFVHLVGPDGQIWGQQDSPPSAKPTDQWRPGEQHPDIYGPALKPDAPAGRYRVLIGWYDLASLRRLPRAGPVAAPHGADYAYLGDVDVRP